MKKKILCFSGWAQKKDSLQDLFEDSEYEIINYDYSIFNNVADLFADIKNKNINSDIVVGWSLGGQIACRVISNKLIDSEKLILIAPAFQFVKSRAVPAAMPEKSFQEFYNNFTNKPDATLKRFALLMNINDKNAQELAQNLDVNESNHKNLIFWLEELKRFSCHEVDFSAFPQTMIFHGQEDMVIHKSQSQLFYNKIKDARLEKIEKSGHVPHSSYKSLVKDKIREFLA